MVEIMKLSSDRWQDYKKLRLEALKTEPIAFGSSYEEEIRFSKEVWQNRIGAALFAVLDDQLIGMVVYVFSERLKTKHIANIYGMYVTKEYRNQQIGSKLIAKAISIITENKEIHKIKLTVNPKQEHAHRLYKKYGFNRVGTYKNETCIDGHYYDELLMEKFI